jgi:hypothetical protein
VNATYFFLSKVHDERTIESRRRLVSDLSASSLPDALQPLHGAASQKFCIAIGRRALMLYGVAVSARAGSPKLNGGFNGRVETGDGCSRSA